MRGSFTFNGINSLDMGLQIEGEPEYITGSKIVEQYSVPGRSGALLYDTGAYTNAEAAYTVSLVKNVESKLASISSWLGSPIGYARLEDTQESNFFRMAYCDEPLQFERKLKLTGKGIIHFNCMPQRWTKNGDFYRTIPNGGALVNGYMPARPLIEVTGSGAGVLNVGSTVVTFSNIPDKLIVDCENCLVYWGNTNYSGLVTLSGYDFPVLEKGQTNFSYSGGITKISVKPRWWTL